MPVEPQSPPQKQILLVDDDRDFRWAIRNILKLAGYGVVEAQDGEEAMSFLKKDGSSGFCVL